jgi:hypothetical protein
MGKLTSRIGVAATLAVALINAAGAQAGTTPPVSLGANGFGQVAVDNANGHVFVSLPAANEVQVFNFAGGLVATIPNIDGATAMVVNGSSLDVVESTTGTIEAISLASLTATGPVATGLASPRGLAFAGGKLWTAEQASVGGGWYTLAAITPTGPVDGTTTYYEPDFATTPGAPNTLYVAEDGLSPGAIYELNVVAAAPVVVVSNTSTPQENIEQLAVSADGTRVIPASGYPYEFEELSASSLSPDGIIYPAQPYPSAVAVSGDLVATGLDNGYSTPDISVFTLGAPQAQFTASTNDANGVANVVPHGLALSGDGSELFAVTQDAPSNTTSYSLRFLSTGLSSGPSPAPTTTSVSASPAAPGFGQAVTLTATVQGGDGGGTVSFADGASAIAGCSAVPMVAGTGGTGSTATCTTASLPLGADPITSTYSGDSASQGSSGSATVTVGKGVTTTTAAHGTLVRGARGTDSVVLTGTVSAYGAAVAGRTVAFTTGSTQLCSAVTGSSGSASCTVTAKATSSVILSLQRSGYTAGFGGDADYLGSSGHATVS